MFQDCGSFAIILYDTMPSAALTRVVKFGDKFYSMQHQHKSQTLRAHGVLLDQKTSAAMYVISSEKPDATIHGNSSGKPAA